jgi:hypothetical protein
VRTYGLILVSAVLAVAVAGAARASKIQLTTADQAIAAKDLLTRADLGSSWKGGTVKFVSPQPSCAGYHPNTSAAVATGEAASRLTATGIEVDHKVVVLRSAGMLGPLWKAVYTPAFLSCLRSAFFLQNPPNVAVASATKGTFPKFGKYTSAYRIVYETPVAGGKTFIGVNDVIAIGNGRTEIVLAFKAGLGTAAQSAKNQKALVEAESKIAYIAAKRAFS